MEEVLNQIDELSIARAVTCSPEQVSNTILSSNNNLTVLTQNIRSISANFSQFLVLLTRMGIGMDVIVLTECWLLSNPLIPSLEGYSHWLSTNNTLQNDGVVVYVKNSLSNVVTMSFDLLDANNVIIRLGQHTVIMAIYRSPSFQDTTNFLCSLDNILTKLSSFKNIIVVGDININIANSHDEKACKYLDLLAFHGLLPGHSILTRVDSCLDHIMLKTCSPAVTMVVDSVITDHHPVLLALSTKKSSNSKSKRININYSKLASEISNIDFTSLFESSDPDFAASYLINILKQCINSSSKLISISCRRRPLKPWITPGLVRCMQNRDNMHKSLKLNPNNESLKITYIRYRNYLCNLIKKLKRQHDKEEIRKAGSNSKKLWEAIRRATDMNKQTNQSESLLSIKPTPGESVNFVNEYFSGVGATLASKITPNSPSLILPTTAILNSFVLSSVDEIEICSIIDSLKADATPGWDNISSKLLKKFKKQLAPAITHICNLCIKKGYFPKSFKIAVIHPILKSGDSDLVDNYRPISILTALSKIMERIIHNALIKYLERNSVLSKNQFGFRHNSSTSEAVNSVVSSVAQALDSKLKCVVLFLDFKKAFDTVSVPLLITKLERIGIRGTQLNLFREYLTDRVQRVKIGMYTSSDQSVNYGVPQGSILGPCLFLIYMNDLCNLPLLNGKIVSFADDTALVFTGTNWSETFRSAQTGLDCVKMWLNDNYLTLNVTKTNYIAFTIRNVNRPNPVEHCLIAHCHKSSQCNDNSCQCPNLKSVSTTKYLGITIDQHLSFESHIVLLAKRTRKLIYIFKKLRYVADAKVLRMTYLALCQSIIAYCITSWGGASKSHILLLERAQRAVLKVCTFKPFRYPTSDLYKLCGVLTVRQLFILATVMLQHSRLPYVPQPEIRNRRLRLPLPDVETQFVKKFFHYLGPYLYKKIHSITNIYSLNKFNCKKTVSVWLQTLTYDETEDLMISLS